MSEMDGALARYGVIAEKNPREIVLLRGTGCRWRRCRFCDYHLDQSDDQSANLALNRQVLALVTGCYGRLEVINSGSFTELDEATMGALAALCRDKGIHTIHFECHWLYRSAVAGLRARFAGVGTTVKVKSGIETFDSLFREAYLDKGIGCDSPAELAAYFDEVCLLFGLPGQTEAGMLRDMAIGLGHFERVCVNIMNANSSPIPPDPAVIRCFAEKIYPLYRDDRRVDILFDNTDFGVGEVSGDEQ